MESRQPTSSNPRRKLLRHGLFAAASFAFAYARNVYDHGQYGWDSVAEFLMTWALSYLALALAGAAYLVVLAVARTHLLANREIEPQDVLVYFYLAVVVLCGFGLLLAGWPSPHVELAGAPVFPTLSN